MTISGWLLAIAGVVLFGTGFVVGTVTGIILAVVMGYRVGLKQLAAQAQRRSAEKNDG